MGTTKRSNKQHVSAYLFSLAQIQIDANLTTERLAALFEDAMPSMRLLRHDLDDQLIPALQALMRMRDSAAQPLADKFLEAFADCSPACANLVAEARAQLHMPADPIALPAAISDCGIGAAALGWVPAPGFKSYSGSYGEDAAEGRPLAQLFRRTCQWKGSAGVACGRPVAATDVPAELFPGNVSKRQSLVYCDTHLDQSVYVKALRPRRG
jgi:hypothetical protein